VSPKRWDLELRAAGFTGVDALAYDNELPYQVTATMVSSVLQQPLDKKRVTFLYRGEATPTIESYKRSFEKAGHVVDLCCFGNDLPSGQDMISFLELDAPFFDGINGPDFEQWIKIASGIETTTLLWLTHCISMGTNDPRYAQVLGFTRTLRSEKHISVTTLEIDDFNNPKSADKAVEVYEQIGRPDNDPELDPDYEFALSNGTVYSSRYHWVSVQDELASAAGKVVDKVLRIGQKGMIDSLRWEKNEGVSRPLQGQEVAVRPHTVGVNFRVSN
jgi:hypothetical protein